jgi:formamidopyrimidine-DNA glycosylase
VPELPEVETIRRGLEPLLTGRRVVEVTVRDRRLRKPIAVGALRRLRGARFLAVHRRSKYLLVHTDAGDSLLLHLGMTGRLWVTTADGPRRPHEHVVFALDDGRELRFADPRRFGMVEIVPTARLASHPRLRGLGPEPVGDGLDADALAEVFFFATRRRRKPVKNFLMDTRTVAGVGNIYACEALFRAGLHPRRAVGRIARPRWTVVVAAVRQVLGEAIEAGGTTLRDFANAEEQAGYFSVRLRVYDREGKACVRCRAGVRRIVQAGRSTFYCPRCQR